MSNKLDINILYALVYYPIHKMVQINVCFDLRSDILMSRNNYLLDNDIHMMLSRNRGRLR